MTHRGSGLSETMGSGYVFWSENDGPSAAWESYYGALGAHYNNQVTGSEMFDILGTTRSTVPVPMRPPTSQGSEEA